MAEYQLLPIQFEAEKDKALDALSHAVDTQSQKCENDGVGLALRIVATDALHVLGAAVEQAVRSAPDGAGIIVNFGVREAATVNEFGGKHTPFSVGVNVTIPHITPVEAEPAPDKGIAA